MKLSHWCAMSAVVLAAVAYAQQSSGTTQTSTSQDSGGSGNGQTWGSASGSASGGGWARTSGGQSGSATGGGSHSGTGSAHGSALGSISHSVDYTIIEKGLESDFVDAMTKRQQHLHSYQRNGKIAWSGHYRDELGGLILLNTSDEDAKRFVSQDPAVVRGYIKAELKAFRKAQTFQSSSGQEKSASSSTHRGGTIKP